MNAGEPWVSQVQPADCTTGNAASVLVDGWESAVS